MKLSVVVPSYNEEKYLPFLLQSLRQQDFPKKEFEIIVVDNNSSDKTASIAKMFGAKVIKEKRQGITYGRDTGAKAAQGEIIVGTDADCVFPKNYLTKVYKRFLRDKKLVGLFGSVFMPDIPRSFQIIIRLVSSYAHWYSIMWKRTPQCWALNFSFRKSAFRACKGYDLEKPFLKMGLNSQDSEDYDMAKRLEKTGGTVLFDKNFVITTSSRRFKNRFLYWLVVEHILGYSLNKKLYEVFGTILPTPSYFDRVSPNNFYRFAYATVFAGIILISASATWTFTPEKNKQEYTAVLAQQAESVVVFAEKISPYFDKYTLKNLN